MTRGILTLRVHSWGGLGSQLLAARVALEMSCRRPVLIVHHTSGVTRRPYEMSGLKLPVSIRIIDDFQPTSPAGLDPAFSSSRAARLRASAARSLRLAGVVVGGDGKRSSLLGPSDIQPWTLELRDSYSDYAPSTEVREGFLRRIGDFLDRGPAGKETVSGRLVVHLRLGDLANGSAGAKGPLPVERVVHATHAFRATATSLLVVTETPSHPFIRRVREAVGLPSSVVSGAGAWDALGLLLSGTSFIGSNSKLSYWAAQGYAQAHLPVSLPRELSRMTVRAGVSSPVDEF